MDASSNSLFIPNIFISDFFLASTFLRQVCGDIDLSELSASTTSCRDDFLSRSTTSCRSQGSPSRHPPSPALTTHSERCAGACMCEQLCGLPGAYLPARACTRVRTYVCVHEHACACTPTPACPHLYTYPHMHAPIRTRCHAPAPASSRRRVPHHVLARAQAR